MLSIQDVHKSYRQGKAVIQALRGLSLHIDEPGFYAIMGRSGSGKSTLLHLLAGLDKPDAGRLTIQGRDMSLLTERDLNIFRRDVVGMVFQQYNLIATLTAEQNVALPGVIAGRPRKWIDARVKDLLGELELTERADHRPDAMSGGEQQRVAIARALLFEPPLLLADEPTGNLDSATSNKLWALLAHIAEQHEMTVVMVTHEPAAASRCRRVFVLADGVCTGQFEVDGLDATTLASRYQQLGR